ncbi:MAG: rhomboid family intramembrane serine protease [Chloroflexi bacterium]|nr:rhomboid family intramembrane serine protease [Chloroflexota bacterium]
MSELLTFVFFILGLLILLALQSFLTPLPFGDTGRVRYRSFPVATFILIVINSFVFIVWTAPNYYVDSLEAFYPYIEQVWTYGFREVFLREHIGIGAWSTFTSTFMHADFLHLFFNMIYLWTFGRRIEDACGPWRFLLFYLGAGMAAAVGWAALDPFNEDIPGIGASGAISGVMGAYLVLFPGSKINCLWGIGSILRVPWAMLMDKPIWRWTIAIPSWILLIYYLISEALPSLEVIQGQGQITGINHLAHFFGFLAAIAILLFVRKDLLVRYLAGRRL